MTDLLNTNQSNIKVRRASVDSVDLYEVKEHELIQLEKGSDSDLYLNFAIFLFSLAFACILALATADFKKPIYQTFAIVIIVVGLLGSLLLLLLWLRNRKSIKVVIKQIKNRLPAEVVVSTNPDSIDVQKTSPSDTNTSTTTQETTKPSG